MGDMVSRRDFLKRSAAGVAGAAALGLFGGVSAAASAPRSGISVAWDGRYDVIVVGFGGAGAIAARHAALAGARVLIVEKAPEGAEGGNLRYCAQLFAYGNGNYENTLAYYKAMAGSHTLPDAVLEVFCEKVAHMTDVVAEEFNFDPADFVDSKRLSESFAALGPEYPELAGSESVELWASHSGTNDGYVWQAMRRAVVEDSGNIDVWLASPAVGLIQEPQTKTVLGIQVERNGALLNIAASNGVVLASGGFENNPAMVESFLGLRNYSIMGTEYNTGDGIKMAMAAGADLWHMDVYEGMGGSLGATSAIPLSGVRNNYYPSYSPGCTSGSVILVAGNGSRFLNEAEYPRHGHIQNGDVYLNPWYPERMFLVMSAENYQCTLDFSIPAFPADYPAMYRAETIDALAEAAGMDPGILAQTVSNYNRYADAGFDPEFGRGADTMRAFPETGPYYAFALCPVIMNTQGGPRRNERAEILDMEGNPIPHLYGAGELGGITALQYQGGSNVAECIIFGQIAGKNAAEPKDALPEALVENIESSLLYMPGYLSDLAFEKSYGDIPLGENEYLGVCEKGMGGDVVVKVTIEDGVIQSIQVLEQNETPEKFLPVLEQIPAAIIAAQSLDVDTVAGSTVSSQAVLLAVGDAIESSRG